MISISHLRLVADLEVDECHSKYYPVVDVCNAIINFDTSVQQIDKKAVNFILPTILFGLIEPNTGNSHSV